jgi:hypothetical protein
MRDVVRLREVVSAGLLAFAISCLIDCGFAISNPDFWFIILGAFFSGVLIALGSRK